MRARKHGGANQPAGCSEAASSAQKGSMPGQESQQIGYGKPSNWLLQASKQGAAGQQAEYCNARKQASANEHAGYGKPAGRVR